MESGEKLRELDERVIPQEEASVTEGGESSEQMGKKVRQLIEAARNAVAEALTSGEEFLREVRQTGGQ